MKILVITSFKDTCYIEILPKDQKSKRGNSLALYGLILVHHINVELIAFIKNDLYSRKYFPGY